MNNNISLPFPTDEFDFDECRRLFSEGPLKDNLDAKNYISSYFYPTKNGTHIYFENGVPTIIQDDTMSKVYLSRFGGIQGNKALRAYYKMETVPVKVICSITEPTLTKKFINISHKIIHQFKPYATFSKDTQDKVKIFLDYVKLIWANNDEAVYNYLLKWFSNLVKGNKNKTCLYAKGPEGIGKSTLTDFFREYVIGLNLYCKGKADHLKGQHNSQLLGKLLVVFEELQCFSNKEWQAVDSELKDMITDDLCSYTDKYEKRFEAPSLNNYIVNTNFNAIKGSNGRRYMNLDINTTKMDDLVYFGNIKNNCFNKEVGHGVFCFLYEIDLTGYISGEMPETKNKIDICVELMKPHEKFLKDTYILNKLGIDKVKVLDVYTQYVKYCERHKYDTTSIQAFSQDMRNLNITYKKYSGYHKYNTSYEELLQIATKKKWLHEFDEEVKENENDIEYNDDLEYGIVKNDQSTINTLLKKSKDENNKLTDEITELKKQIEELKKLTKPKKQKQKTINDILDADINDIEELSKLFEPIEEEHNNESDQKSDDELECEVDFSFDAM